MFKTRDKEKKREKEHNDLVSSLLIPLITSKLLKHYSFPPFSLIKQCKCLQPKRTFVYFMYVLRIWTKMMKKIKVRQDRRKFCNTMCNIFKRYYFTDSFLVAPVSLLLDKNSLKIIHIRNKERNTTDNYSKTHG